MVEPELKDEVKIILKGLGISVTEAINIYFTQIKDHRNIPFEMKSPNKETLKAMEESDNEIGLTKYDAKKYIKMMRNKINKK